MCRDAAADGDEATKAGGFEPGLPCFADSGPSALVLVVRRHVAGWERWKASESPSPQRMAAARRSGSPRPRPPRRTTWNEQTRVEGFGCGIDVTSTWSKPSNRPVTGTRPCRRPPWRRRVPVARQSWRLGSGESFEVLGLLRRRDPVLDFVGKGGRSGSASMPIVARSEARHCCGGAVALAMRDASHDARRPAGRSALVAHDGAPGDTQPLQGFPGAESTGAAFLSPHRCGSDQQRFFLREELGVRRVGEALRPRRLRREDSLDDGVRVWGA